MRSVLFKLFLLIGFMSSPAFSVEPTTALHTLSCVTRTIARDADVAETSAPKILDFFSTPAQEGLQAEIDDFNKATKSIHYIIFNITDPEVAQALVDAKNRGLDVQVIHDSGNWEKNLAAQLPATLTLQKAGIVTPSSAGFQISHPKTASIDAGTEHEVAWITSRNATTTYSTQRDAGVKTNDRTIIQDIEAVFTTDLENAKTGGTASPALKSEWLVCSPVNGEPKLVNLINSAAPNTDLYATSENLGDPAIQRALIAAQARKVRVHVLAPLADQNVNPQFNIPYLTSLKAGGVDALGMPGPGTPQIPYMHQKMIIVDTGSGLVAYLGSVNLSKSSAWILSKFKPPHKPSREIGIIFKDPKVIKKLIENFSADAKVATSTFQ